MNFVLHNALRLVCKGVRKTHVKPFILLMQKKERVNEIPDTTEQRKFYYKNVTEKSMIKYFYIRSFSGSEL